MIELNIATLIIGLLIQLILVVAAILYIKQMLTHKEDRFNALRLQLINNYDDKETLLENFCKNQMDLRLDTINHKLEKALTEFKEEAETSYTMLKEEAEAVLVPAEKMAAMSDSLSVFSKRLGAVENMSKQFETDINNLSSSKLSVAYIETVEGQIQAGLEALKEELETKLMQEKPISPEVGELKQTVAALQFTIKELLKMLALSEELSRTVNYINNTPNLTAVDKANYEQRAQELVNQITESRKDLYKTE